MTWHYNWTNSSSPLTESEAYDNAYEIFNRLTTTHGFTDESASAVIANFQSEGLLNPCQWQIGSTIGDWDDKYTGLGLGQWTPPRKLANALGGTTQSDIANGDGQVDFTVSEESQWVQRINSSGYSKYYQQSGLLYITSIAEFKTRTDSPEDLAIAWCCCWEGCSKSAFDSSYTIRRTRARYWYNEFTTASGYPISITVSGNGTAWASKDEKQIYRAEAGDRITIAGIPNDTDTFITWTVEYPTTLTLEQPLTFATNFFTMPNDRVSLIANFTGETPPPTPPTPTYKNLRRKMPIWMYPILRK